MGYSEFTIDEPLVDANFNELDHNRAQEFIRRTVDEQTTYRVTVDVKNMDMVPTALMFSIKTYRNIEFIVRVYDFPGCEFVLGFLKSSKIKELHVVNSD